MDNNNRTESIDCLKLICAFLIVCIHAPFPGELGKYFIALTRIAVPIFLMISGYFYKKESINKQIRKMCILLLVSNSSYTAWYLLIGGISGNKLEITWKSILAFVLFNDSPVGPHLWYIGAILYVLVIVKYVPIKYLYYLTPILLIGDLVLGKYSIIFWGKEIPYVYVRNFLFVGIPYFCIGNMLKKENKLHSSEVAIILLIGANIAERFLLIRFGVNASRDHYISTTFLAIAILCYAIESKKICKTISALGRDYSTKIYILHPIIIDVCSFIANKLGVTSIIHYK